MVHKNETFALTWDQERAYWSQTRGYVEQFLRDAADSTAALSPHRTPSPPSTTTPAGRAQNDSLFGGGCIDYGSAGGTSSIDACEFGNPCDRGRARLPGQRMHPLSGDSFIAIGAPSLNNGICLTDAQLQGELSTMIAQTGIVGRTKPGYTPLVTLLLPPGSRPASMPPTSSARPTAS